jgi:BirA family biotin operon repressor/biotin-[acetyl-CoA-carboxylase] ligase
MTEDPVSDPYDIARLRRDLQTSRFGHPLEYRDRVTSTNDRILDMALRGAPEGTIALTEEQTAGRGRRGHVWYSPPKMGIWSSFLLRPRLPGYHIPALTLCAAHAVAQVIEEVAHTAVWIKWPNDIILEDRKVAGILGESKTMPREGPCVVIGIGINVHHTIEQFPPELQKTATSLRIATGRPVVRQTLFCRLVETFEATYQQYLDRGLAPFLPDLSRRLAWRGHRVEVLDMTQTTIGKVVDVREDGSLMLETDDQGCVAINSGTLRLRD